MGPSRLPGLFSRLICPSLLGFVDTQGTQTPRYLIEKVGTEVLMECLQNMDHERTYWYRQDRGLGLQLLHWSYNIDSTEKGDAPDGYSVSRKKKNAFPLALDSASTNQTSLYLCASSKSTVPHSHILSAQKGQISGGSDPNSGLSCTGSHGTFVPIRSKAASKGKQGHSTHLG
uniref:Immunoglobulin V-set domain-containing protein n=1 Tax=Lynx canadensis TaxID=61383 RepID=A0A667H757_LYNCA